VHTNPAINSPDVILLNARRPGINARIVRRRLPAEQRHQPTPGCPDPD
jgi:hypothetical protein